MRTFRLTDIIGSISAVSPRAGLKAYDFVTPLMSQGEQVHISLEGLEDMTSAFANAFVG